MSARASFTSGPPTAGRRTLGVMLGGLALLGPLSVDAYLPAFDAIEHDLVAGRSDLQFTLTAYMLAYAGMSLLHGALADAFGRRRVILLSLFVFALAALGCALSPSIGWLSAFRVLQGVSAGAGTVVGRAIIRDCFEGAAAASLLAMVSMVFSLSPALAPVFGGWMVKLLDWRAIFLVLFAYTTMLLLLCLRSLPETLPPHARQALHVGTIARQYGAALRNRTFTLCSLAIAFSFAGLFIYVASAPAFLGQQLGLPATAYAWLFVPIVAGIFLGSLAAERLSAIVVPANLILAGFAVQLAGCAANAGFHAMHGARLPWSVLPLAFYAFGMSLAMPYLALAGLDQLPHMRGKAASCQAFAMVLLAGAATHAAPLLGGCALPLALTQGLLCLIAFATWLLAWSCVDPASRLAPETTHSEPLKESP